MAIYLDSAIISEAKIAQTFGWVKGITTNPTLLAKTDLPVKDTLEKLAELTKVPVFYQLISTELQDMVDEGKKAFKIIGEQTVLKIPATTVGFQAVSRLAHKITCSVTAIYSPAQAAIAKEAGAKYAIAYVNRATKLLGDGISLVKDMATILADSNTEILAASIKSPEEAAASLKAGAHHLTLPLAMLESIATHQFSLDTVAEFNKNGRGLVTID